MLKVEIHKVIMVNITCITLTLTLVIAVLGASVEFELKCPDSSQRNLRAQVICNGTSTSRYYCLLDENRHRYVEQCNQAPDHVRSGEKYVITGRRRNVDCPSEKLQPFLFWSNAYSDCVFLKSQCNEPGQLLYNNGTTMRDRSCRCDYSAGYAFVTKPKHKCYCVPSNEDCSCYRTACVGNHKLTPDYECVIKYQDTYNSLCPPILIDRMRQNYPLLNRMTSGQDGRSGSHKLKEFEHRIHVRYGFTILCCVIFLGLFMIGTFICGNHSVSKCSSKKQTSSADQQHTLRNVSLHRQTSGDKHIPQDFFSKPPRLKNKIELTQDVVQRERNTMLNLFIETNAYVQIWKLLNEKHVIIIKGNPGDGKTTLAHQAMFQLMKDGKYLLQLYSYNEFDECVTKNQNLVIFIDNLFGEYFVSKDDARQWCGRLQSLEAALGKGNQRNYIIITIRNDIYHACSELVKIGTFFKTNMIDIAYGSKYGLTNDEMGDILINYTGLTIPENDCFHDIQKFGFPQCCRLYKDTDELQKKGIDFFKRPLCFLVEELEFRFQNSDMKMAVLVCILLHGGTVKKSDLHAMNKGEELKVKAMSLCSVKINFIKFQHATSFLSFTTSVKENNEEYIKFSHSSVKHAIFLVIGRSNPSELIQHCDFKLLSMITTENCKTQKIDSLVIPDSCIPIICSRIKGLLSTDMHSSSLLKVISDLNIWNDLSVFDECIKFENLFVAASDEKGWCMLEYFAAVNCLKWVEYLYKKCSQEKAYLALKTGCGANALDVVKFLIDKGCTPDITCCFNAVKGGHIEVILELVKAGVNITDKCKTLTNWGITTSVLQEAAKHNQRVLIKQLLEKFPDLIKVTSSNGATVMHFIAEAGDIRLLKDIIKKHNFSPYDVSDLGSTILHYACQNDQSDAVQYIINEYPLLLMETYYCFERGTILHTAAESGNLCLFQSVLRQNKKLWEANGVETIRLYRGCHMNVNNEKQYLVDRSMILHVRDYKGYSILHKAVWSQSKAMVKFIVNEGLDIANCISDDGSTVADFLVERRHTDVDDMLLFLKEEYNIKKTK